MLPTNDAPRKSWENSHLLFLYYLFLASTRVEELILGSTIILHASDTSQAERAQSPVLVEMCSVSKYFLI